MNYRETIMLSLISIRENKHRTFLTLLGIIVGISAIIIVVSLGSGVQKVVAGEFESFVSKIIMITPDDSLPYHLQRRLSLEDKSYLEESVYGIKKIMPIYNAYFNISYERKSAEGVRVIGVHEDILGISGLNFDRGIKKEDVINRNRVVVVSEDILHTISDNEDYELFLGELISIDGFEFQIIDIFHTGNGVFIMPNNAIYIPHSTFVNTWREKGKHVTQFMLQYYDDNVAQNDIIEEVEFFLNAKYGTTINGSCRFFVTGIERYVDIFNNVLMMFTILLGSIASISLFVGGIGVMNIMLTSVKERIKEIGIRKAIGASIADIRRQFLIESVILSISGGIIGVILGVFTSVLINFTISQILDIWKGYVPVWSISLSFFMTVFIGIIFGFYPAYLASRLDPVDAIRYS